MNRDFLSNFEPNPTKGVEPSEDAGQTHTADQSEYQYGEQIRNVCFVWPDGKHAFFNYGRLDSGEMNADNDSIRLVFWSDIVELIGIRLLPLLKLFLAHKLKFVYCDDVRYNDLTSDEPVVNEIVITQKS